MCTRYRKLGPSLAAWHWFWVGATSLAILVAWLLSHPQPLALAGVLLTLAGMSGVGYISCLFRFDRMLLGSTCLAVFSVTVVAGCLTLFLNPSAENAAPTFATFATAVAAGIVTLLTYTFGYRQLLGWRTPIWGKWEMVTRDDGRRYAVPRRPRQSAG